MTAGDGAAAVAGLAARRAVRVSRPPHLGQLLLRAVVRGPEVCRPCLFSGVVCAWHLHRRMKFRRWMEARVQASHRKKTAHPPRTPPPPSVRRARMVRPAQADPPSDYPPSGILVVFSGVGWSCAWGAELLRPGRWGNPKESRSRRSCVERKSPPEAHA